MAKLLDKAASYQKFGIGRAKFDSMVREGLIPPPKYLPGCTKPLWLESGLDKCIEESLQDEKPKCDAEATA